MRTAFRLLAAVTLLTALAVPAAAQQTTSSDRSTWVYPLGDRSTYSSYLFDLLEFQRVGDASRTRWNFVGWRGGDRQRLWVKSEGALEHRSQASGNVEVQALYGKLISPYFDFQAGVRVEQRREVPGNPIRTFAVVGLQGLAPYHFDLEPAMFLSHTGKISGRFAATYGVPITQRMTVQGRFEATAAAQQDIELGTQRGLNETEVGVRLRHEINRELAPYVGASYRRRFGNMPLTGDARHSGWETAIGVRALF